MYYTCTYTIPIHNIPYIIYYTIAMYYTCAYTIPIHYT